jgi:hypothetical protein
MTNLLFRDSLFGGCRNPDAPVAVDSGFARCAHKEILLRDQRDLLKQTNLILPDGQISKILSSPVCKNIFLRS